MGTGRRVISRQCKILRFVRMTAYALLLRSDRGTRAYNNG